MVSSQGVRSGDRLVTSPDPRLTSRETRRPFRPPLSPEDHTITPGGAVSFLVSHPRVSDLSCCRMSRRCADERNPRLRTGQHHRSRPRCPDGSAYCRRRPGRPGVHRQTLRLGQDCRAGLAAMLDYARAGDIVVVTAIDRLGRSVAEVTRTIVELGARRILLRALREGVDTATPTGRGVAAIMAALAELELELAGEGRAASRESRRARQLPATKPTKLTTDRQEQLRRLAATGEPVHELAKAFGIGRATEVPLPRPEFSNIETDSACRRMRAEPMRSQFGDSTRSVKAVSSSADPGSSRSAPSPVLASTLSPVDRRNQRTSTLTAAARIRRGDSWNRRWRELEGAAGALAFGSGMAAISAALRVTSQALGRCWCCLPTATTRCAAMQQNALCPWGLRSPRRTARRYVTSPPRTPMWCWPRRPTNPGLDVVDLHRLATICHRRGATPDRGQHHRHTAGPAAAVAGR